MEENKPQHSASGFDRDQVHQNLSHPSVHAAVIAENKASSNGNEKRK